MRTLIACVIASLVVVIGLIPLDMLGLSDVGTGSSATLSLVIYAIALVSPFLSECPFATFHGAGGSRLC
jgi:hypothetical protein